MRSIEDNKEKMKLEIIICRAHFIKGKEGK
jgi:hypothetical protein